MEWCDRFDLDHGAFSGIAVVAAQSSVGLHVEDGGAE